MPHSFDLEGKSQRKAGKAAVGLIELATGPQMFRLNFAALRLGKTLPSHLTTHTAAGLIYAWFNANPGLEDEYQEMKEVNLAVEMEFENIIDNLDDWRALPHKPPAWYEPLRLKTMFVALAFAAMIAAFLFF
jgi:hypothetical protein